MAKYDALFEHLCRARDGPVEMSFHDIGHLVGGLPASATVHKAWWGNEVGGRHVQAAAWINAGREVDDVDMAGRVVRFSAAGWRRGS